MAEREKEIWELKLKRKDSETMEKSDCSKRKDKRLKLRKEGGEMDQSTRKEMDTD